MFPLLRRGLRLSLRGGTLQAAIGGCVIIAGSASGSVIALGFNL